MIHDLYLSPQLYHPSQIEKKALRDGYGEGLVELGQKDPRIVVLTGDLSESTRAHLFQKQFPDRFFEMGVAEQNLMGVAAGLGLSGKVAFVSSYAAFSPGRSWDQFRVSVCYSRANVKVVGGHTGLDVGPDGATHQALEDLAMTRVLPNVVVVAPCDYWEARKATVAVGHMKGPAYLRITRDKTPLITTQQTPFHVGQAYVMREGRDVSIIGCGPLLYEALQAAEILASEGIAAEVINNHTIKPLDKNTLLSSVQRTGAVVTVEDHQINGGLGGAICELCAEYLPVPVIRVGMKDEFGQSGTAQQLYEHYGLTSKQIAQAARDVIKRKR